MAEKAKLKRSFSGAISLAPYADKDGIPEMNRMAYNAGRVFVSCSNLK